MTLNKYCKNKLPIVLIIILIFFFCLDSKSNADRWESPRKNIYFSENKLYRLIVYPKEYIQDEDYLSKLILDKELKRESTDIRTFDQKELSQYSNAACYGFLEEKNDQGAFDKIREVSFVNVMAPAEALISNSGDYIVTLDNWGSIGYGDDILVIYDQKGELVRRFSLKDFYSEQEIKNLNRSVSSIYWRGKVTFVQEGAYLKITLKRIKNLGINERDIFIDLNNGSKFRKKSLNKDKEGLINVK